MNNPKLTVGDPAPQFKTSDALGRPVDLASYKDGFVLLVMLRYSGCPLCNLTIHRLTLEAPMLAKNGCKVIAFIQSDAAHIKANIYERHKPVPEFPIVPDDAREFYDCYGVHSTLRGIAKPITDFPFWLKSVFKLGYKQTEVDGSLLQVPAAFLIGPGEQTIVKAEYDASFYEHATFTDIYEALTFA